VEDILLKMLERVPEAISFLKKEILEAFGPLGLMIAVAVFMALAVYSVFKIVKFLFKVVAYIIIPALLVYFFIQIFDPSLLKSF